MLICDKNTISVDELHAVSTRELRDSGQLSVRASNACLYGGLRTLYDLVEYYKKHDSFNNIRNVGRKSSQELEAFCQRIIPNIEYNVVQGEYDECYDNIVEEQNTISQDNDKDRDEDDDDDKEIDEEYIQNNLLKTIEEGLVKAVDFFNYVSLEQKNLLINRYNSLLPKYSVRTANRLKEVGYDNFITNYLFKYDNALLDIKHLGKKSQTEAIDFKSEFKEEVAKILSMTKMDFVIESFLKDNSEIFKDNFISNFYKENKYLPMFWRLEKEYKSAYEERNMDIFINSYPVFNNNTTHTLNELAKKHNITRERTRQIRNKFFERKINLKEDITKNLDDWEHYTLLLEDEKIIWNNSVIISKLLEKESSNFTTSFAFILISELCKDSHKLFKDEDHWSKSVLINKAYVDIFDFEKFIEEFQNYLASNDTEHDLNVEKDYLPSSDCWKSIIDLDKFDDIVRVVKDILLYEFQLYSEPNGLIKIPATKKKNALDVVYEILKDHGNPMHIDDIFIEFKKILPEHNYSEASQLRSWLQRHKAISYRSRKSVYTLKEWKHVKSGTIRDAIVEFLLKNDTPKNADEITDYVLQFFPKTNKASIRTSMFNDTKKRFSFFGNNLFGLISKDYPSEYEEIEQQERQRKSFEQRLYDLEKFISENDHFPFASSANDEETALNRWWRNSNTNIIKLTEKQKAEIERVKVKYNDFETDKATYEWFCRLKEFKLFVLENRRLPSSRGDEKFLYNWLRRAKRNFEANKLNEKQRQKFVELFKEIDYVDR